jgi:hypothetical protein
MSYTIAQTVLSLLKHVRGTIPGSSSEAREPTLPYDTNEDSNTGWTLSVHHVDTDSSEAEI